MDDRTGTPTIEIRRPASPVLLGHLSLGFTAVMWGASFVGTKLVVDMVPPFTLGFARAAAGTALLVVIARLTGQRLRVSWRAWRWMALLGALGVGYFYLGINLALLWTTATAASLLSLPYPVMTAIGARRFLDETVRPRQAVGIVLALAGAAALTVSTARGDVGGAWIGNLLAFSTTVAWTAYTLIGRDVLPRFPPLVATTHVLAAGAVTLLPFAVGELALGSRPALDSQAIAVTAFLGLGCTGLAYVTWNHGLALLGATRASVYLYVQPAAVVLLALPILGERPSLATAIAGVVVVLGTWMVVRPTEARD